MVNGRRIWRQEHRYIMEQHLGRALSAKERVHHIDFDTANNSIGNLYLCRSVSAHRTLHNKLEKLLGSAGVVKRLLELDILAFDPSGGNYYICETLK